MVIIEETEPATWDEFEARVTQILIESGLEAERNKRVSTARGQVSVDVYVLDSEASPTAVILVECKHWKRPVPQTVVHSFRTVVEDSGANVGMIVSRSGFQAGAEQAARNSNIRLLDWRGFEALFVERWYRKYMMYRGWQSLSPLIEYTEPINTRVFRKADALDEASRTEFRELREKYQPCAMVFMPFFAPLESSPLEFTLPPDVPLAETLTDPKLKARIPTAILEAASLRSLLDSVITYADAAVAEFDAVFGKRA